MEIKITIGEITLDALLDEKKENVQKIVSALPLKGRVQRWGDEIYFATDIEMELEEDAVAEVEVGDIAYWTEGKALCLFFGRTPVSDDDQPKAISPVNKVGRIKGDLDLLKKVNSGDKIIVSKA